MRPILIAAIAGIIFSVHAAGTRLMSASTVSPATRSVATDAQFLGVMGEVARPGVYQVHAVTTVAQLVKFAGGVTVKSTGTVRVFRSGRLAEQIYLGSGAQSALFSGDLVVVEGRRRTGLENRRTHNGESDTARASSQVQIAFLNLIARPVIVKMLREQANVARIVEILGQRPELATSIRVVAPCGAPWRPWPPRSTSHPLESGTVLIFQERSVRADALPALPSPVATALAVDGASAGPSQIASASMPGGPAKTGESRGGATDCLGPSAAAQRSSANVSAEPANWTDSPTCLATARIDCVPALPAKARASHDGIIHPLASDLSPLGTVRTGAIVLPRSWDVDQRTQTTAVAPQVIALTLAMAVLAALAIIATLVSMVARGTFQKNFLDRWRIRLKTSHDGPSFADVRPTVPAVPLPSGVARLGRPVRIDAAQPITRLSVDLEVVERSQRSGG